MAKRARKHGKPKAQAPALCLTQSVLRKVVLNMAEGVCLVRAQDQVIVYTRLCPVNIKA